MNKILKKWGLIIKFFDLYYNVNWVIFFNGLTFFGGYYSKDLIIEFIYLGQSNIKIYAYIISIVSVLFTTIYSVRFLIMYFIEKIDLTRKFLLTFMSPLIMILHLQFYLFLQYSSGC